VKKTATFILALMFALFVCLSVCVAEDAENTGAVQKYGDIGRLSNCHMLCRITDAAASDEPSPHCKYDIQALAEQFYGYVVDLQ